MAPPGPPDPKNRVLRWGSLTTREELLAAKAPRSDSPFLRGFVGEQKCLSQCSPLSKVWKRTKSPRTGSPRTTPRARSVNWIASQKPSLSGLVKLSFHDLQASVVL